MNVFVIYKFFEWDDRKKAGMDGPLKFYKVLPDCSGSVKSLEKKLRRIFPALQKTDRPCLVYQTKEDGWDNRFIYIQRKELKDASDILQMLQMEIEALPSSGSDDYEEGFIDALDAAAEVVEKYKSFL